MNRYWYVFDHRTVGPSHKFVCGWCFGDTEDQAREKARAEARRWHPELGAYVDTATIHLQFNQNTTSSEPAVW